MSKMFRGIVEVMGSGHNVVTIKFVEEYFEFYGIRTCDSCDINLLVYVGKHNRPIHRHSTRFGVKYRCDHCYDRLYGGVTLWKDYPEEMALRNI